MDDVELVIERPVAGGHMLARHEGRVIFVAGAIPGERVRARIERVTKQIAWGQTVEVLEASPDRRDPGPDPSCGGAFYSHVRYARQLALKAEVVADAFARIAKRPLDALPAVASSPEHGYRLRARLHVVGRRVGFFREGTHDLCDHRTGGQLRDDTFEAIDALTPLLGDAIDDCAGVIVSENVEASERVVHFELTETARLDASRFSRLPTGVTGVTIPGRGGSVEIAGRARVADTASALFGADPPIAADVSWSRRATSFVQANRFLTGTLARDVLAAATGAHIVDLYSGVGLFAVAAAARGADVIAVEGDESSGGDLTENARPWSARLSVMRASVEDTLVDRPDRAIDSAIVDPPRTGLSTKALRGLAAWRARRIVYVSCDPPTLARDSALLYAAGYARTSLAAYDFFPNTPHVECLAVFDLR